MAFTASGKFHISIPRLAGSGTAFPDSIALSMSANPTDGGAFRAFGDMPIATPLTAYTCPPLMRNKAPSQRKAPAMREHGRGFAQIQLPNRLRTKNETSLLGHVKHPEPHGRPDVALPIITASRKKD